MTQAMVPLRDLVCATKLLIYLKTSAMVLKKTAQEVEKNGGGLLNFIQGMESPLSGRTFQFSNPWLSPELVSPLETLPLFSCPGDNPKFVIFFHFWW